MFAIDDEGDLARPAALGRVELDDDTITFTSEGSDLCAEGDSWAWRASLPETGLLHIEHTEEAAGACRVPLGTEWTLTRLFPPSAAIREIAPAGPAEGPPPTASDLAGFWIRVDPAGLLLRFGSDGTFAIDSHGAPDTNPGVVGTYELEQDAMTFTIGGGYACTAGGSFGWRVSLPQDGLLRIVHTKEGTGNCLVPRGTEWTIVRVSPSSAASAEITAQEAAG